MRRDVKHDDEAKQKFIAILSDKLPPILHRHLWPKYKKEFGLPYSLGGMQNFDCENKGPKRFRIENKIAYLREDYLAWLSVRIKLD